MILDDLLSNIDNILGKLSESKLDAYALTQYRLHQVDVSKDEIYRKKYTGFYRLRLPVTKAYNTYFTLMECYKSGNSISLIDILIKLKEATGRIETSFGSKLLATINPNVAPLDKVILSNLGLALPNANAKNRLEGCVTTHNQLMSAMNDLVSNPKFSSLKMAFKQRYPKYKFTDIKILDLLLWQFRP
jgi:hypothetical protein